jgi:Spy/CpxP family protein refolding chaperone
MRRKLRAGSLGLALALATAIGGLAEDSKPKSSASKGTSTAGESRPRRQLPYFFGKLGLNDGQREKIYDIQGSYQDRLDRLQAEIDQLIRERNKKTEAVLTPGQRMRLKELRMESAGS